VIPYGKRHLVVLSWGSHSVGIDLKELGGGGSPAEMFEILPRD